MSILKENGLELKEISSKSIPSEGNITDVKSYIIEKFNENGMVVAYLDYKVLIGRYADKKFIFSYNEDILSKYIQKIRIFNYNKEIYIWRTSAGFKGRIRRDGEGEKVFVVDAQQILFGTSSEDLGNGFTRQYERRGTEIILPFSGLKEVYDQQNRILLKNRNYINFNKTTHQASYSDVRFVEFSFKDKKLG